MEKNKKHSKKELSKREKDLRAKFAELQKLIKKYNVKPFDRKEIYGASNGNL